MKPKFIRLDVSKGESLIALYEMVGDDWKIVELYHSIEPVAAGRATGAHVTNLIALVPSLNAGVLMCEERKKFDLEIRHMEMVERSLK